MFNEAAIFDYLWCETEQIVSRSMTIMDIFRYCQLDAQHTESFRFVRPGTSVDDLVEIFRAIQTPLTRIGAVFVTSSGKEDQAVQRLITPWDVLTPNSQ